MGHAVSSDGSILCEAHGGPAHGRQLSVPADPEDRYLPVESVQVRVDNHAEAIVATVTYTRREISQDTQRWVYRPITS